MAQTTDIDIRELKDLIQGLDKKMEGLDKKMEIGFANVDTKFANIDRKMEIGFTNVDIKFANIDRKMEIGFANVDIKFANVDTKFAEIKGQISALDLKIEERTRLGFWGFIFRGSAVSVLAGLILVFVKYLFPLFGTAP